MEQAASSTDRKADGQTKPYASADDRRKLQTRVSREHHLLETEECRVSQTLKKYSNEKRIDGRRFWCDRTRRPGPTTSM